MRYLAPKMIALWIVLISLLSGCAMQPNQQPVSANIDYFAQGQHTYQDWLKQTNQLVLLAQAKRDLTLALQQNPSHIKAQYYHYRAVASLALATEKVDEAELLSYFNQLNPSLLAETVSPAYVSYAVLFNQAKRNNQLAQKFTLLQQTILRAIKQNPYTSQNWLILSELFQAMDKPELALAAAEKAKQIAPDEVANIKNFAMALNNKSEVGQCVYQQTDLLDLSLQYFEQAQKMQPNLENINEFMAFQAFRLGDFNKAKHIAAQSFAQQPSYSNSLITFETSLLLGDYNLADQALIKMQSDFAPEKARQLYVLLALAKQDNKLVGHYLSQLIETSDPAKLDIYIALLIDYVQQNPADKSYSQAHIKPTQLLNEYFYQDVDDKTFLTHFNHACDKANAYYMMAFKALNQQKIMLAYQYFNQVIAQKAYRQSSYLWASVMLKTEQMQSYTQLLSKMRIQAKNGDAQAQFKLGLEYYLAELVTQDLPLALKWLNLAAKQNHQNALNLLAYFYLVGEGVEQNTEQAIKLYLQSAELGNAQAYYQLAELYLKGEQVEQNIELAIEYFERSANLGYADALVRLANIYTAEPEPDKAFELLQQSALAGSYQGQTQLALFYQQQEDDDNQLTALAWLTLAKKQLKANSETAAKITALLDQTVFTKAQINARVAKLELQIEQYQTKLSQETP
ncbi:sel1 repeat family protein [Catenovulum sp. 2E275]|uniref:SEL1-like repeat protein n=1 Tax=Catenovulum sp. 2E275 TaxID=2980497 RepID=UPI0021CE4CA5|nr:tetratricopeptide repeat protein [Catenovulum sp. 2E275]MCU4677221.1 sel1 repeat family protein [Catenovulum sp. 2E275]